MAALMQDLASLIPDIKKIILRYGTEDIEIHTGKYSEIYWKYCVYFGIIHGNLTYHSRYTTLFMKYRYHHMISMKLSHTYESDPGRSVTKNEELIEDPDDELRSQHSSQNTRIYNKITEINSIPRIVTLIHDPFIHYKLASTSLGHYIYIPYIVQHKQEIYYIWLDMFWTGPK